MSEKLSESTIAQLEFDAHHRDFIPAKDALLLIMEIRRLKQELHNRSWTKLPKATDYMETDDD